MKNNIQGVPISLYKDGYLPTTSHTLRNIFLELGFPLTSGKFVEIFPQLSDIINTSF